jgi:hypothetical protein
MNRICIISKSGSLLVLDVRTEVLDWKDFRDKLACDKTGRMLKLALYLTVSQR